MTEMKSLDEVKVLCHGTGDLRNWRPNALSQNRTSIQVSCFCQGTYRLIQKRLLLELLITGFFGRSFGPCTNCPFSLFKTEWTKVMSVKSDKVTFNEKATSGCDTPGEVKKKTQQKSHYNSGPHALYPQLRVERDQVWECRTINDKWHAWILINKGNCP